MTKAVFERINKEEALLKMMIGEADNLYYREQGEKGSYTYKLATEEDWVVNGKRSESKKEDLKVKYVGEVNFYELTEYKYMEESEFETFESIGGWDDVDEVFSWK